MKNLKNINDFVNEQAETSQKERLINRIKNLIQRSLKVKPWDKKGKVYLDDCYGWRINRQKLDVISVDAYGINCDIDMKETHLSWEEMMDLSEYYLREIYNNLEGTIRNDAW